MKKRGNKFEKIKEYIGGFKGRTSKEKKMQLNFNLKKIKEII